MNAWKFWLTSINWHLSPTWAGSCSALSDSSGSWCCLWETETQIIMGHVVLNCGCQIRCSVQLSSAAASSPPAIDVAASLAPPHSPVGEREAVPERGQHPRGGRTLWGQHMTPPLPEIDNITNHQKQKPLKPLQESTLKANQSEQRMSE